MALVAALFSALVMLLVAVGRTDAQAQGEVWAWGVNSYGQLGSGTSGSSTPVQVSGLSDVKAVAAGGAHSLAVKNNGTVWAWGYNGQGQLGDGTTTQRNTPVQVSDISGVQAIAAGDNHSLTLKDDGTLWAWGDNSSGQLGDGTYTQRNTPVQVSDLSSVQALDGGHIHSLAVTSSDAGVDTTAPKVTSTIPKTNATEVAPTANVRATFSEDMDSTTINGTTFKLFKKGTTTQIPAQVGYNADTHTAKLDPTNNLRRGVAYKAVVSTVAKDVAGNRLDQNLSLDGPQQMKWFFRVDD